MASSCLPPGPRAHAAATPPDSSSALPACPLPVSGPPVLFFSKTRDGSWLRGLCLCNRAVLISGARSCQILLIPSFAPVCYTATLCCHCVLSLPLRACGFLKGRGCFTQLCTLSALPDTPAPGRAFWVHGVVTAHVFLVHRPPMIPILTPATMICTQVRLVW